MIPVSMIIWAIWLFATADAEKVVGIIPASGDTQLHSSKLFLCKVKGGEAEMKWLYPNGMEIDDGEDKRFVVETVDETTITLLINSAETHDNGIYTCVSAFEDRTEKRATVEINVVSPPTARISEESVNATAGSASSITCVVEGHPHPHINWTRNGRPIKAKPGRFGFNSDQSVLTIYAVEKTDEGQYTCITTNKINSSSANVTLHVSVKPEVQLERSKERDPRKVLQSHVMPQETPFPQCTGSGRATNWSLIAALKSPSSPSRPLSPCRKWSPRMGASTPASPLARSGRTDEMSLCRVRLCLNSIIPPYTP
ncbi:neural cell adhesion molecule 1-B-like [Acipenser oxyrinchus oxyrinchus]|uniref:Neural cell adhesion molecule 1-B-like n=1 Tax=Acipenser oxyrinchus oxyrinchus TaxID=40147 RepID=A0AAD8FQP0_ACIOX|nr:neural cell adhesion molecule 1-B-like [Acipenser oxyrinchus oxyrinchus]